MRVAPTTTEALRGSRLGVAFRRQVVLGEFIADFIAPSVRLVVEVDGGCHAHRARADAGQDRAPARLGYCVIRVPAAGESCVLAPPSLPAASSRSRPVCWPRVSPLSEARLVTERSRLDELFDVPERKLGRLLGKLKDSS